jgi:voltage-gated potassium channel
VSVPPAAPARPGPAPPPSVPPPRRAPSARQRRVYELLDGRPTAGDPLDVACYWLLLGAIVVAVGALVVGTVPEVARRWGAALAALDLSLGVLFAAEYAGRVWSAPVDPRYRDGWRGRLRYARSPLALLDLAAVAALLLPHLPFDLRQARLIRLFALLRVGKLGRFGRSATVVARAFRARRDELLVAVGAVALVLFVGSTLVYFAEHEAQPDKFGSIPEALWWGVATVTTVGYGDVYPVTPVGRVLGGVLAVLGIGSFALPTAILGSAFLDEVQRARGERPRSGQARPRTARCPTCGRPYAAAPAPGADA